MPKLAHIMMHMQAQIHKDRAVPRVFGLVTAKPLTCTEADKIVLGWKSGEGNLAHQAHTKITEQHHTYQYYLNYQYTLQQLILHPTHC